MLVYVINLSHDVKRLNNIKTQMDAYKIPFRRVPGIYGKDLTQEELSKNTTNFCKNYCPRSTIGCAMSHLKAMKTFITEAEDNEKALIMEDDAILCDDFLTKLDGYIQNLPKDFNMVYLGCFGRCHFRNSLTFPFFKIQDHKTINDKFFKPEFPLGLQGYIISKKYAEKLLKQMEGNIASHIDLQMNLKIVVDKLTGKVNDTGIYATSEELITQDGDPLESNIGVTYPFILNKLLYKIKDIDGQNIAYKCSVNLYNYNGIPINGYILIFLIIGMILRFLVKDTTKVISILMVYTVVEAICHRKMNVELFFYPIVSAVGFFLTKN